MNSFEKCRAIEQESDKDVYKFLTERYDFVIHTDSFKNNRTYQSLYGDYLCVKTDEKHFIEVKAEKQNKYNNFYLETWSNKPQNVGWFKKCKADVILYHFLDDNVIYLFDLGIAQQYIKDSEGVYAEKPQSKYSQMNKAYGLCVPIADIMKHAGIDTINLTEK